jgi:hypothetical protein
MAVIFTLRLFDAPTYAELVPILEGLAEGRADAERLAAVIKQATARVDSESFRKLNEELSSVASWPQVLRRYLGIVEAGKASELEPEAGRELSEMLVASLCMPDFQAYYTLFSATISEATFILGQWDEGLLCFLRENTGWFDTLFAADAPLNVAPFPYGQSMAVLTRRQVEECRRALDLAAPRVAPQEGLARQHARLAGLVARAAASTERTLALTSQ